MRAIVTALVLLALASPVLAAEECPAYSDRAVAEIVRGLIVDSFARNHPDTTLLFEREPTAVRLGPCKWAVGTTFFVSNGRAHATLSYTYVVGQDEDGEWQTTVTKH